MRVVDLVADPLPDVTQSGLTKAYGDVVYESYIDPETNVLSWFIQDDETPPVIAPVKLQSLTNIETSGIDLPDNSSSPVAFVSGNGTGDNDLWLQPNKEDFVVPPGATGRYVIGFNVQTVGATGTDHIAVGINVDGPGIAASTGHVDASSQRHAEVTAVVDLSPGQDVKFVLYSGGTTMTLSRARITIDQIVSKVIVGEAGQPVGIDDRWTADHDYVIGNFFVHPRNLDGLEWLYQVPPGFVGKSGLTWDATEEARYTAIAYSKPQAFPTTDQLYDDASQSDRALAHEQIAEQLRQIRTVTPTTRVHAGQILKPPIADRTTTRAGCRVVLPAGIQRSLLSPILMRNRTGGLAGTLIHMELWYPVGNYNNPGAHRIAATAPQSNVRPDERQHEFILPQKIPIPDGLVELDVVMSRVDGVPMRHATVAYGAGLDRHVRTVTGNNNVTVVRGYSAVGTLHFESVALKEQHRQVPPRPNDGKIYVLQATNAGETWVEAAGQITPAPVEDLFEPTFLAALADPGQAERGDLTFVAIAAGWPAGTRNQLIEFYTDVPADTDFGGIVVNSGDVYRATEDVPAATPANWRRIVAGDSDTWPTVGAADGVIASGDKRLLPQVITLPDSAGAVPPAEGLTMQFLPDTGFDWNDWGVRGGRFETEGQGPTRLPFENSIDGSDLELLTVSYPDAGIDEYQFFF